MPLTIEAVTVCSGYGDLLAETVRYNRPLFDRWVIATTPDDDETRELCRRHNLHCLVSAEHHRDGADFAKGRLIARALDQLQHDGWLLHLDADVVLPGGFRRWLVNAHLDPACLYGCDRVMVRGWEQWQALQRSGYLQHDYGCRVNFPPGYEVGTRWASEEYGYCPIGFFQLLHGSAFNWRGIHSKPYPSFHNDAARGDVQFALQWDRRQRVLLPEVVALHLESEAAPLGANWKGRTTKRFGPTPVPATAERRPS